MNPDCMPVLLTGSVTHLSMMGRSDKRRPDQRNVDSRAEHGVVTVTLNPAIDLTVRVESLKPGAVHPALGQHSEAD